MDRESLLKKIESLEELSKSNVNAHEAQAARDALKKCRDQLAKMPKGKSVVEDSGEQLYVCRDIDDKKNYITEQMGSWGGWGTRAKAMKRTLAWWRENVTAQAKKICEFVPVENELATQSTPVLTTKKD